MPTGYPTEETLPDDWTPLQRLREALRYGWLDVGGLEFLSLLARVRREPTDEAKARRALALVQALPYRPDTPGKDEVQSASTTARIGGDCEDKAALVVILLRCCGIAARLLWIYQPTRVRDHVSAQAFIGGAWRWLESTINAGYGEDPYAAADRLAAHHTFGEEMAA